MNEGGDSMVYFAVFGLSSFVLGIVALLFKLIGMMREIGKELHTRVNKVQEEVAYERGYREGSK
jgi:hypothetical protein